MSAFRYYSITDFSFEGPLLPLHEAAASKDAKDSPSSELNIPYTVFEVLVAIVSIIGNVLVIIVFRRERIIISMCWVAGTIVGFLPLFGWHADVHHNQECLFVEVMDYNYLVFLYFATIITPALLMLAFYTHIYRVIIKQVRQIVTMNPASDLSRRSSAAVVQITTPGRSGHTGTMLRVLGAARKRDVKATQNLSIIVLFFMICWIPLYTINCIKAFCPSCYVHPKLTLFCIILSHLNSAVNPVLYAYHLKDFRAALKNLLLKMMGVDIDQQAEAIHRFSVASQHRLQSMDSNMRSTQPRLYVDSPIWLRQQQEALKNSQLLPKCGVVSPCFNNINQTVAAVASVTTEIEREMWNIVEASSGAELGETSYEFPSPAPASQRSSERNSSSTVPPAPPAHPAQPVKPSLPSSSYDNHNFSFSQDEDDEDNDLEFEDVFVPPSSVPNPAQPGIDPVELRRSLALVMREKLRSDDTDSRPMGNIQEIPVDGESRDRPLSIQTSPTNGPLPALLRAKLFAGNSNSAHCLPGSTASPAAPKESGVFVIDSEASPGSNGHKPKYRKGTALTRSSLKKSRSCNCSSLAKGSKGAHEEHSSNLSREQQDQQEVQQPKNQPTENFFSPLRSVGSFMQHSNLFHFLQPHPVRPTSSTASSSASTPTPSPPPMVQEESIPVGLTTSSPSLLAASAES
uniref:Uncharacterized protein LOC108054042 n=1 Tax=Drosophila rhopaloa TaxID=1041015 RepID=A0A6P4FP01_DRORH